MVNSFRLAPLGTIATVRSGYAFKSADFGTRGFPVIKIKNVVPPIVDVTNCECVSEEVIARIPRVERFELKEGDTLIAMTGATVGKVGRFPRTLQRHFLNQRVGKVYLTNQSAANNRFVYYVLSQESFVRNMFGIADGSAQANISGAQIESLEVPLPPLAVQIAIANLLGSLDDMIDLNRRMNATLEGIARALFQSWFVDFDPVRAKLDGRQPFGMEQATADLFPDAFQDSPLGPIPKGWWIKRLDEVADLNWGDTNKTKSSYIADGFTAYSASGADGFLPTFDFDRTGVVVSAIGANAGITWFASGKWSCIKNTLRFWATSPDISTEFLYFSTYGMDKWPQRGSAQSFISQGDARAIKIVIPGNALGCLFGEKAGPLLTCISDNEKRSRTLAGLRDTLLPKLLSGELSVDEAGRCVEQAV